jgi:hypothetical protein
MGGNSKNQSFGNGFRKYQSDSNTSANASAYEFCVGDDKN